VSFPVFYYEFILNGSSSKVKNFFEIKVLPEAEMQKHLHHRLPKRILYGKRRKEGDNYYEFLLQQ